MLFDDGVREGGGGDKERLAVNLIEHARRRLRLAGGALIAKADPVLKPFDEIAARYEPHGGNFVSFAAYDYLGLSSAPQVTQASASAVSEFGAGVGASRLVGGERRFHRELEQALASHIGVDDTLVLVSGYLTNLTLVSHLVGKPDLIVMDALSHNSLFAGSRATEAEMLTFRHNDLDHLAEILSENRLDYRNVLIVVEGLYSMDGDIPDLERLVALKRQYDCWLLVDEAHSIGVLGEHGRGLCEHCGIDPREVDMITGTLSKAFGACGGFVAGNQDVLAWLRYTAPGFVFSVGMPPAVAAAAHTALHLLQTEPERIVRLHKNSQFFLSTAHKLGLDTGNAIGRGVFPIMMPDKETAIAVSLELLESGFYCPPIVQIGVPRDQPRLRWFITSEHTFTDIEQALSIVARALARKRFDGPALHAAQ